jgi:hypothetical protein
MEEAKKESSGRQLIILGLAVVVMRRHLLRALEGSPRSVLTSSPLPKPSTRQRQRDVWSSRCWALWPSWREASSASE